MMNLWTQEDEQRLIALFDSGKSIDRIARSLRRSRRAIEQRLVRIGSLGPMSVEKAGKGEP